MSSSTARIVLKRGSAALFGSSSRQQPRLALRGFSRLIPDPNSSNFSSSLGQVLHFSQFVISNGRRVFPVDTLALVRKLEAQGLPSKHAETIASEITKGLTDILEIVAQSFVSKREVQKSEMTLDDSLSKFKSEMLSFQEHNFSLWQREIEKLQADIEKMRSETLASNEKTHNEFRYDIEKVRSETLARNEKTRFELRNEICENRSLVLREISASRAEVEVAKYQVKTCCVQSSLLYVDRLIDDAEATYEKWWHRDPYIVPWAPGGTKFTRNSPPPSGIEIVYNYGREEAEA